MILEHLLQAFQQPKKIYVKILIEIFRINSIYNVGANIIYSNLVWKLL